MRWLRWLLVLAALAGLGYLALAIEIGGRTPIEWVAGSGGPDDGGERPAAGGDRPDAAGGGAGAGAAAAEAAPAPPAASDHHTDADRAELDRLIESRLQQEQGDGESEPH
jgi:hypothetical protein